MLICILIPLAVFGIKLDADSRLEIFRAEGAKQGFSRKEYLTFFKMISTATASRDLAKGVLNGVLLMKGEKAVALYSYVNRSKDI